MAKGEFIGREALQEQLAAGVPNRFVTVEVHDVGNADPLGNEPLFDEKGAMVGRATSGYYGHVLKKSLAIGYVKSPFAAVGTRLQMRYSAKKARRCGRLAYDPENWDPEGMRLCRVMAQSWSASHLLWRSSAGTWLREHGGGAERSLTRHHRRLRGHVPRQAYYLPPSTAHDIAVVERLMRRRHTGRTRRSSARTISSTKAPALRPRGKFGNTCRKDLNYNVMFRRSA